MIISSILLVDHRQDDYQTILDDLSASKEQKFSLAWATSTEAAWEQLSTSSFDLVLVADRVGDSSGVEFIQQAISSGYQLPFILIAGEASYETDLEAMRAGARDYLNKAEITPALLERSIRYAIEAHRNIDVIRKSEERFYLAARAVNGVVYDWDLATNQIFRSDGLQQVIGVRPSEITQEHGWWENRVHPEDYPLVEKTVNEKINGDANAYELEYRVQHLSGYWIDVWERAYILRDNNGKAYRVVGTRTDITERKRNEKNARFLAELGEQMLTLRETETMFAYAGEALMQYLNLERITFDQVNQRAEKVTILYDRHLHPPEITGTHDFSSFHRELQKRMIKGQAMVVEDTSLDPATVSMYEAAFSKYCFRSFVAVPRLTQEGWVATISASVGYPRHWRNDEVILLKQSSDLVWLAVENARLVKELREAQERFEIMLKNSQITVYTCDLDRRYTWVANSVLQTPDNSIIGKRDEEVLPEEDIREIINIKKAVLASGIGVQKECKITFQNSTRYIDLVVEPLRGSTGEIEGLIVAASDKTQKREIEQQIQQAASQLEIQRRMEQLREEERQQIARDLHDGPIQSMIGLLFSIKTIQALIGDGQASQMLVSVEGETQKLVTDLRNLCNELRPPVLVQFGLSSAIRSHATEFQHKHPEVTMHLELSDAGRLLPDNVRLALYRIYQEALNNVVRHSSATEVTVSLSMVNHTMQLEITDNGEGFQFHGEMVNLAREGHFGLVGMSERAEAIGGTFKISSTPGSGTRIMVKVPVLEVTQQFN